MLILDHLFSLLNGQAKPSPTTKSGEEMLIMLFEEASAIKVNSGRNSTAFETLPESFELLSKAVLESTSQEEAAQSESAPPTSLPVQGKASASPSATTSPSLSSHRSNVRGSSLPETISGAASPTKGELKEASTTTGKKPPVPSPAKSVSSSNSVELSTEPSSPTASSRKTRQSPLPPPKSVPQSIFKINFQVEKAGDFFQGLAWQKADPDRPLQALAQDVTEDAKSKQMGAISARHFFTKRVNWHGKETMPLAEDSAADIGSSSLEDFMGLATENALNSASNIKGIQNLVSSLPSVSAKSSSDSTAAFFADIDWDNKRKANPVSD